MTVLRRAAIPLTALALIGVGAAFYMTFGGRAALVVGLLVWLDLWIAGWRTKA